MMPSSAIASAMGLKTGTRSASRLWLSASMPVAAVSRAGRLMVNSGSAITTLGSIPGWTMAFLAGVGSVIIDAVSTSAPVPAVVGMAMTG